MTVTLKPALAVLPWASVAEQVTVVSPSAKVAPEADEQLTAWIDHFELNRQRAGLGIEHAGVVHVLAAQWNRIRLTGDLERHVGEAARRRHVRRRDLRTQLDAIGANDLEQRCALVVRSAERREHVGDAAGDGRADRERVAGRHSAAAAQGFIALRQACFRGAEPGFRRRDGSASILDAPCRDGPIGKQAFGSGVFSAGAVERDLRLRYFRRERRTIVSGCQTRFETSEDLTGANGCPDRDQ